MSKELKKCPFCGSDATMYWQQGSYRWRDYVFYFVECNMCGVKGRAFKWHCDDPKGKADEWSNVAAESARTFWNTRAIGGDGDGQP